MRRVEQATEAACALAAVVMAIAAGLDAAACQRAEHASRQARLLVAAICVRAVLVIAAGVVFGRLDAAAIADLESGAGSVTKAAGCAILVATAIRVARSRASIKLSLDRSRWVDIVDSRVRV